MHYLLRKVIIYAIVIVAVANLDFFLPRIAVGNPAFIYALGSKVPQAAIKEITTRLGLNQPLYTQYVDYLQGIFLTFPPYLGVSYSYYPFSVWEVFATGLPWDVLLLSTSVLLAFTIAYVGGIISALRRGKRSEVSFLYSSIITQAIPGYWIAMVVLWAFAVDLRWFPVLGGASGSGFSFAVSVIQHVILPVVVMGIATYGQYYLVMRGTLQQVLKSDYVLAAECRGLRDRIVARRYILRNALLPVVSALSFSFAGLISATVVVETVFSYPGTGGLFVDFVNARDYPGLTGFFFLVTVLVVIIGLAGDLLLWRLDPRVR